MYEIMTKSEYAFNRLRDDILDGTLPSGSKLVIKDLADRYNISAMPIRSAIVKLEEIGYVRSAPHIGAWVNQMDLNDYFTFMLLRTEVESLASMMTAVVRTDKDIENLEILTGQMDKALSRGKTEEYAKYNRQFHSLVYRSCQNPILIEQLDHIMERTQIASFFLGQQLASVNQSFREQVDWLNAIKARDADRCYSIVRYQRTRFNLSILHHLKNATPEALNNAFLRQALQSEDTQKAIDRYIEVFKKLQNSTSYRPQPDASDISVPCID